MKEILIKNGNDYRTVPATSLRMDDDNSYYVGGVSIESDVRSNTSFCNMDSKSENKKMLSLLIELLYEKFISGNGYKYCLINEDDMTVLFKHSSDTTMNNIVLYEYINNKWDRRK